MTNDEAREAARGAWVEGRLLKLTAKERWHNLGMALATVLYDAYDAGHAAATSELRATGQLCTVEERDRLQSAADQYRERLNVSEAALAKERGLTQSLGARCKELHEEAHRAARLWESAKNHSLHDIRAGMRRLREVLNGPNGARRAKGGSDAG